MHLTVQSIIYVALTHDATMHPRYESENEALRGEVAEARSAVEAAAAEVGQLEEAAKQHQVTSKSNPLIHIGFSQKLNKISHSICRNTFFPDHLDILCVCLCFASLTGPGGSARVAGGPDGRGR